MTKIQFPNNLIALRKREGMSIEVFSEKFGVSKNTIYNYENSHYMPSVEFLIKIKLEYGLNIDDFLFKRNNRI
jgi:transcriptional regulator with XRE-family HTH domain